MTPTEMINEACEFLEHFETHRKRMLTYPFDKDNESSLHKAFRVLANAENETAIALLEEAINDLKMQRLGYLDGMYRIHRQALLQQVSLAHRRVQQDIERVRRARLGDDTAPALLSVGTIE